MKRLNLIANAAIAALIIGSPVVLAGPADAQAQGQVTETTTTVSVEQFR